MMSDRKKEKSQNPPAREKVWEMFDRIAPRYDLLNRMLSFGQDIRWRNKVVTCMPEKENQTLLDLACGTGDLMLTLCNKSDKIVSGVGLDMAEQMMAIGKDKINQAGLSDKLQMVSGNAEKIPFQNNSFDLVTIAFGIRNVVDVGEALKEMKRVLNPDGRAIILEFSLPQNVLIKRIYLLYFRYILPFVGSLISGDSYAYRYLNKTVETFPYGQTFCDLMKSAGFSNVKLIPLTFGVASIYVGENSSK